MMARSSATEWAGTMNMKSNGLGYFFKEGCNGIFRHGFMSFAAICIIVACLILMGSFLLIAYNISNMITDYEQKNVMIAYVDDSLSETEAQSLGSKINLIDNVMYAQYISKEQALEEFVAKYEGNELMDELESEDLRDRYHIYMEDIAEMAVTQQAVEDVDGIAKVNAKLEISEGFVSVRNIVGIISIAMVAILLVISLFIISNTIKLATFDRREEIAIMKMVGATNSFIRWPYVFQGFILGIFSAVVAFFLQWGIYAAIVQGISSSDTLQLIDMIPYTDIWQYVAAVFGVTGFIVGVGGSAMTIRKYLKV